MLNLSAKCPTLASKQMAPIVFGANEIVQTNETPGRKRTDSTDKPIFTISQSIDNLFDEPKAVREILQGNYNSIPEPAALRILEDPMALDKLINAPKTILSLYQAGQLASKEHKELLHSIESPETFNLIVNPPKTGEALKLHEHLKVEPLIIHDLFAHPKALANFYNWIAEEEKTHLNSLVQQLNQELSNLNKQAQPIFGWCSPQIELAPTLKTDIANGTFALQQWVEKVKGPLQFALCQYEDHDLIASGIVYKWAEKNPSKGIWEKIGRPFTILQGYREVRSLVGSQESRLKKMLALLNNFERNAVQAETQYEMMKLMNVLVRTLEPQIKGELEQLQTSPFDSFKELFSIPNTNPPSKRVLFGKSLQEVVYQVRNYYAGPPRPEGVKKTINYSIQGAFAAGLFSGVVGATFSYANFLYKKAHKWITGNSSNGFYRQEAWVEDIVGRQMINKIRNVYQVPISPDTLDALYKGATLVSRQGFFAKFLSSLFSKDIYARWAGWTVNKFGQSPIPQIFDHVSTLNDTHETFQSFVKEGIKVGHHSIFTERLSTFQQWCSKLVPPNLIEKVNDLIEPVLRQGDQWVDSFRNILQHVPFFGKILHLAASHVPFKTELLTASTSFSYNLITGLGNMALIEEAKQHQGQLPKLSLDSLNQASHWKVIQTYIDTIYKQINTEPFIGA